MKRPMSQVKHFILSLYLKTGEVSVEGTVNKNALHNKLNIDKITCLNVKSRSISLIKQSKMDFMS